LLTASHEAPTLGGAARRGGAAVPARAGLYAWRDKTAVGTVAACGFSGVLYKVITSPEVLGLVKDIIGKAFKLGF
jgi:hypothetical protein